MDCFELKITELLYAGTYTSEGLAPFYAKGIILQLTLMKAKKATKIISSHKNMLYIYELSFSLN